MTTAYGFGGIYIALYDEYGTRLAYEKTAMNTTKAISFTYGIVYGKTYYLGVYSDYSSAVMPYKFSTSYQIMPTAITSIMAKEKGFSAKWEKKVGASFYQLRYTPQATYSDYKWAKADKARADKASKTVKKLSKQKYRVQVRVARTIAGVTYYSAWSNAKKVVPR